MPRWSGRSNRGGGGPRRARAARELSAMAALLAVSSGWMRWPLLDSGGSRIWRTSPQAAQAQAPSRPSPGRQQCIALSSTEAE
eukprot:scaffold13881_cov124-Isochrysis_galbana.AAC.1